ncbi:sigma-54-dependent Fis family transcriptional regulator [Candidatus Nitrospira salsa]
MENLSLVEERYQNQVMTRNYYQALSKITKILSLRLDLESCLKAVVAHFDDVVSWDKAEITLFLAELDSFQFYAVESKLSDPLLRADCLIHRKGSGIGWVYENREPHIRTRLQESQLFVEDYTYCKEGLSRMVTLPLLVGDKCLGTFNVGCVEEGQPAEDEIDFLSQISTILGLLVSNELAHEQLNGIDKEFRNEASKAVQVVKEQPVSSGGMVGQSKALKKVQSLAQIVAHTDSSVLITGETGTGKELLARYIHNLSPRCHRPFIAINCAGLPSGLVESELFGHEKGAFTGADELKLGRFELANGGTLFLDEIGEMPQSAQSKLLRVLEDGQVDRVGGKESILVDVRIIAATNSDLKGAISDSRFRVDLFYRLHGFPIVLPPLRDRPTDIPLLAQYFLDRICTKFHLSCSEINPESLERLMRYSWPGNVRELQNVIQRAAILSESSVLVVDDSHFCSLESPAAPSVSLYSGHTLREVEKNKILQALEQVNWRIDGQYGAAKLVGLNSSTFRSRLKKLGIQRQAKK